MTFGAYHMYITTNMINENNRNNQLRFDELLHLLPFKMPFFY
jgi:hypothetical protein